MTHKQIIAIIVALLAVAGIYWYVSSNKAKAPEISSETSQDNYNADLPPGDVPGDDPENNPTIPTADTIAVSTQIPGSSVTVDNAFLEKAGFITIHEVTTKGQPGNIIGTSGLLSVGAKQDLEINATLVPGAKYIAMLHVDNGDKKFNAQQDEAVMKDGGPVMTLFSVSQ